MKVECMMIRSATRSWKSLCEEAAEFATNDPEPDASELWTDVYR